MATYLYSPKKYQGLLDLAALLGASRLRRFDGLDFWLRKFRVTLQPGDTLINWGGRIPELDGVTVINPVSTGNREFGYGPRADEIMALQLKGVPTIAIYSALDYSPGGGFLRRAPLHEGGRDLLYPRDGRCEYLTVKEDFVDEVRIHSFDGRSIRAGRKVVRQGYHLASSVEQWQPSEGMAHPWIKSWDGGWEVDYNGFKSNGKLRKIAHLACAALGLTFASVDIGQRSNGSYAVIGVNSAPLVDGGTIQSYVRAITRLLAKPEGDSENRGLEAQPGEDDGAAED